MNRFDDENDSNIKHRENRKAAGREDKIRRMDKILAKFDEIVNEKCRKTAKICIKVLIFVVYIIFLVFALIHNYKKALPLVIFSLIGALGIFYFKFAKFIVGPFLQEHVGHFFDKLSIKAWSSKYVKGSPCMNMTSILEVFTIISSIELNDAFFYKNFKMRFFFLCLVTAFVAYLIIDTSNNRYRLVSLGGMSVYLVGCFMFSTNPRKIKWRPVIAGMILQFCFGLIVLRWPPGLSGLSWFSEKVTAFLDYAQFGAKFVYGFLAAPPNICDMTPVFAFSVIQTLFYFGSIISILYYFGIMQFILRRLAWFMQLTLGITAVESINAAGCIFLGMTESPLLIRPYMPKMTKSELHTMLTSGFACIAGSLLAAYVSFGACPVYLICACVMSAPASVAISKLLLPETEESQLKDANDLVLPPAPERNVLEAISQGATSIILIVAQVLANLVVFVAILTLIDDMVWYFFDLVGWDMNFQTLLGYIFLPLAFVMGSSDAPDWERRFNETLIVAKLMGTKTVVNEFVAYRDMSAYVQRGELSGRSQMIATFALCGFSNIGSIGIQIAFIDSICPEKKPIVVGIIVRALIAGSISCFVTACLAGIEKSKKENLDVAVEEMLQEEADDAYCMLEVPKTVDPNIEEEADELGDML